MYTNTHTHTQGTQFNGICKIICTLTTDFSFCQYFKYFEWNFLKYTEYTFIIPATMISLDNYNIWNTFKCVSFHAINLHAYSFILYIWSLHVNMMWFSHSRSRLIVALSKHQLLGGNDAKNVMHMTLLLHTLACGVGMIPVPILKTRKHRLQKVNRLGQGQVAGLGFDTQSQNFPFPLQILDKKPRHSKCCMSSWSFISG